MLEGENGREHGGPRIKFPGLSAFFQFLSGSEALNCPCTVRVVSKLGTEV
jgi:hypothetical protein